MEKKVYYWSDGPSCPFKNQFHFTNILFYEEDHGTSACWNYFATSHGKGKNDGVGGDVKNYVWRKTLQKKVVVTIAHEFLNLAKKKFQDFVITLDLSDDIRPETKFLKVLYENHSKPIPKTHSIHHFNVAEKKLVSNLKSLTCKCHPVGDSSANSESVEDGIAVHIEEEIKQGDYVKIGHGNSLNPFAVLFAVCNSVLSEEEKAMDSSP